MPELVIEPWKVEKGTWKTEYQVKPLACWGKMKELRRKQAREIWEAKKQGRILILGLLDSVTALPSGLGNAVVFTLGPYFGKIMDDPALAIQCCEATEARGFGPDTCATLRIQLGSIYLGFHNRSRTGERVVPDFCLELHLCSAQSKIAREMSEHYRIPMFSVEMPPFPNAQDYFVDQMQAAIQWMEKITGKTYDDEKLIQAVHTEWQSRVHWARICQLIQNVPAPLDQRMLASVSVMLQVAKTSNPEVAEFLGMLLEETRDRVRDGVSALGVERARLLHEGFWPQYASGAWAPGAMLRAGAQYGAVFVGSRNSFGYYGAWDIQPDGGWEPSQTLEERGITLHNRQEALRSLADLFLVHAPTIQEFQLGPRVTNLLAMVRDWKINGVVFNLDRSCHGMTPALLECRLALQKQGVPTTFYEASYCDPREFNRVKVAETLESFFEGLGLPKLTPAG